MDGVGDEFLLKEGETIQGNDLSGYEFFYFTGLDRLVFSFYHFMMPQGVDIPSFFR